MSPASFWMKLLPRSLHARLSRQSTLLAVIHNTAWLFVDKMLRMALGVLVGAWVARYLGPAQFGELSYILSFVALFSITAQLGLDGVAIRDMAREPNCSSEVLGTTLALRLATGVLAWLAAIAMMAILRPGDHEALLLTAVAAAGIVFQAADTVDLWFQSQTQSKRTVIGKGTAFVAANALKVAMILGNQPLAAFVAVGVLELAFAAAALFLLYRRFPAQGGWHWSRGRAVDLLRESFPYLVAGLAVTVYMRIDQLMLRDMSGEHELGVYSAALPLSTALHFIPMALCMSAGPTIAQLRQSDPQAYERALFQLFSLMWWLMLPVSALVALLSEPLTLLLYGPAYDRTASILSIHVFSSVPVALGVAQSLWIVNERKNMIALYRTVIGAVANILLNIVLIPRWGGMGAAMATLVSHTAAAVVANLLLAPQMFRLQLSSLLNPRDALRWK